MKISVKRGYFSFIYLKGSKEEMQQAKKYLIEENFTWWVDDVIESVDGSISLKVNTKITQPRRIVEEIKKKFNIQQKNLPQGEE